MNEVGRLSYALWATFKGIAIRKWELRNMSCKTNTESLGFLVGGTVTYSLSFPVLSTMPKTAHRLQRHLFHG